MSSKSGGRKKRAGDKTAAIAENRRARHDYTIADTLEAGLALQGTEVKSLRANRVSIAHAYAMVRDDEAFLINADIPEYAGGNRHNHAPKRARKLLLHRREIDRLLAATQREGMTLVPLKLYFNARGRAKLLLGLAKGRKKTDKREVEKKRDWQRDKARLMRQKG